MYSARQFPICSECHMKRISEPVTDPRYKKLLDIPTEFYEKSMFLRNIKEAHQRFGTLTKNQIDAFKKAVEDLKNPIPQPKQEAEPIEITFDIYSRKKRKVVKK